MSSPQPAERVNPLPLEIWWLVCKDLAADTPDFHSLYNFALVNRDFARISLPMLYGVHYLSPVSTSDTSLPGKAKLVILWRSLILSSIGRTAYPYVLWIRKLELGNLSLTLEDISRANTRADFFRGDMTEFELLAGSNVNNKGTRTSQRRINKPLDIEAICLKVGDLVTGFVKAAADRDDKNIALASLEGFHIPINVLPVWVSRLSTLRSLTLRDGSVLSDRVAEAIRLNCPVFRELCCFYCHGDSVDDDIASFFAALEPDSLESFSVISSNRLGRRAFAALSQHHSQSLKYLMLSSLEATVIGDLDALAMCKELETLRLEGLKQGQINWKADHRDSFEAVTSWLKHCRPLKSLCIDNVPDTSPLLAQVLVSEDLRLKELRLTSMVGSEELFVAAAQQKQLQRFQLSGPREYDPLDDPNWSNVAMPPRRKRFLDAVSSWPDLVELELNNTAPLASTDLLAIAKATKKLERISFDGILLRDHDVWNTLLMMPCLKAVHTYASTEFTAMGIIDFIFSLVREQGPESRTGSKGAVVKGEHWGFSLQIMNQDGYFKLSEDDEHSISTLIAQQLGGSFSIVYYNDPDEEHESGFSD